MLLHFFEFMHLLILLLSGLCWTYVLLVRPSGICRILNWGNAHGRALLSDGLQMISSLSSLCCRPAFILFLDMCFLSEGVIYVDFPCVFSYTHIAIPVKWFPLQGNAITLSCDDILILDSRPDHRPLRSHTRLLLHSECGRGNENTAFPYGPVFGIGDESDPFAG